MGLAVSGVVYAGWACYAGVESVMAARCGWGTARALSGMQADWCLGLGVCLVSRCLAAASGWRPARLASRTSGLAAVGMWVASVLVLQSEL